MVELSREKKKSSGLLGFIRSSCKLHIRLRKGSQGVKRNKQSSNRAVTDTELKRCRKSRVKTINKLRREKRGVNVGRP